MSKPHTESQFAGSATVPMPADSTAEPTFDPQTFDPATPAYTRHPQAWFGLIHAGSPVFYSGVYQAWMVYDHAVGRSVLSDLRFSRDRSHWARAGAADEEKEEEMARWPLTDHLRRESPFINQAKHRSNRALYSDAFKPRAIARIERIIGQVVAQHCAALTTAREVDLVSLIEPIPNTVIARVVGVSPEARAEAAFKEAASKFLLGVNPFCTEANKDIAESGTAYLFEAIGDLVDQRLRQPADDLVSGLLAGIDSHTDTAEVKRDIILSVASLLSAGTDTTRHAAAFALRTLLQRPALWAQLRADRSLLDGAVLELLRYEFPAKFLVRFATEDIDLGGHRFARGDMVLTTVHGLGWDPRVFTEPERIDFHRDQRKSPVFGHGEFYCIGAHLAKSELRQLLGYFLDHLPDSAVYDESKVEWQASDLILRGLDHLPLVLR